jgi:acyl carrier protein
MSEIDEIICTVLSCEENELLESATADNIAGWDSLTHVILLSALEEEFSISFSEDEMVNNNSIGKIRQSVAVKSGK